MTTAKDVLDHLHKSIGSHIGGYNSAFTPVRRIPTGVFPFDLATGGGLPTSRMSIIYGPESSGKTSLALKATAQFQKQENEKPEDERNKAVFIDIEGTTEEKFASFWGVDWSQLIHLIPEFGEQAIDMTQAFLESEDVGLVVVDSMAALTAMSEAEMVKTAEKAEKPGGGGGLGKRLTIKATHAMNSARTRYGRQPTFILINQPRKQIGIMYGNPETIPGGVNQKFASSLTIRLWGKRIIDEKFHKSLPYRLEVQGRILKWKVPIVGEAFQYALALEAYKGLSPGDSDDFKVIKDYLASSGKFTKEKNVYTYNPKGDLVYNFDTLKEFRQALLDDAELMGYARETAVEYATESYEQSTD